MAGKLGTFTVVSPTRYVMTVTDIGVTFDLDRVRRDHNEFWGELIVTCTLKGAKTIEGILSAADVNLSSQQARTTRAKYLNERAQTKAEIDWVGLTEEFCQRVIAFDRQGSDAPLLTSLPIPVKGSGWTIDGLTLLERHPMILFGDGGQGKSLLALYLVGRLAQQGIPVLYCDWEFDGESHRERYHQMFGAEPCPTLRYARCDRPLVAECDRIRRLAQTYQTQYLVCDSIVFACGAGTPPESAEAASNYFQALRQIGIGSLNLAHTTKQSQTLQGDDKQQTKPFGSVFWSNGARATLFVKGVQDRSRLSIGLFPRKANTGPLGASLGWSVDFGRGDIAFSRMDVASHGDLGHELKVWERVSHAVEGGAMTTAALADLLGIESNTIIKAIGRKNGHFSKFQGTNGLQLIGLASPRSDHDDSLSFR
jgi:hypothetical protein